MLDIDSEHITYGEVYEVTDQLMWKALDELEGYIHEGHKDNEYDKIVQTVETDQGEFEAVVYVARDRSLLQEFIPGGNWRVWKEDLLEGMLYFAYGSCMDNDRFIKHGVDQHFQDCLGRAVLKAIRFDITTLFMTEDVQTWLKKAELLKANCTACRPKQLRICMAEKG